MPRQQTIMEIFERYAVPALKSLNQYIPPSILGEAASYLSSANDSFQALRNSYLEPYVVSPSKTLLNSSPDMFSIFALCLLFVISLKVLDYTRRVIVFWVTLIFRLLFWSTVIGISWYAYSVGREKASRDAAWVFGVLQSFIHEFLGANTGTEAREAGRSDASQDWR
ncbi:hypothetical protein VTO42DRAFT_2809 [Malbranchea cinnamomea]